MDDLKIELQVTFSTGEKQVLPLDACIIGGIMGDGSEAPMGSYLGSLGIERSIILMTHVSRAFMKTMEENIELMTELKVIPATTDKKRNLKAIRNIAINCVDRAMKIEVENDPLENVDIDTHMVKMRWDKGKHGK